jgi:predicted flap endonuclease-1-like 5' DNA nuclease
MGHLTLELILWLLLAFLIGCILGCLFRKLFGGSPDTAKVGAPAAAATAVAAATTAKAAAPKPAAPKPAAPKPVATKVEAPKPAAPKPKTAVATGVAKRPKGMVSARGGKADELQRISGIGPKIDKTLQSLGYFHFDQIANWNKDEEKWVDEHLRFSGRIEREEWISQAKLLAAGKEAEFTRLYGSSGMKFSGGKTASGSRTPKASSGKSATATAKPKTASKPKPKAPPKPKKAVATGVAKAPRKLTSARGGKADDLQRISGVGPKLEKTLHGLGFFHFDQISEWTPDEVQWVDENLTFKGRIDREEWIPQAKLLAAGDEKKFARRYGTGGLKDRKTGKAKSGSRTRKS